MMDQEVEMIQEGVTGQVVWVAIRSQKRQGKGTFPRVSRRVQSW